MCELSPDPIFVVSVPGLAYPVPVRICFRVFLPSEKYLNLVTKLNFILRGAKFVFKPLTPLIFDTKIQNLTWWF